LNWLFQKLKKYVLEKIFRNSVLPSGFSISETHFEYKIIQNLYYENIFYLRNPYFGTPNIIDDNFDISKNVIV